ncbi:hypothetical protein QBC34DRAFT_458916 [Podospora aff. communis PSN243]|uniref:Uncharacterized protein n=1 Tax=Podospora aff. communis PSN243 TaxID=3040156 RepID=A0AAV9GSB2_9PEZI|nr:hypothetical protein QBC34DRAFT_458916 [Podospora aff. communis PSN243]
MEGNSNNSTTDGMLPNSGAKEASQHFHRNNGKSQTERQSLDDKWHQLASQFNDVHQRLEKLADKSHQLSQTRLVYMQIAESRKAIEQADSVRRLTTLAFVFIPLTYVASVFGAELSDMDDSTNGQNFAIASIVTTLGTILAALYLEQYIWPALKSKLNLWRVHVYRALGSAGDGYIVFSVFKRIFVWKGFWWSPLYGGDRPSKREWVWLPLATLDLGMLRLRRVLRKLRRTKVNSQQGERELDAQA